MIKHIVYTKENGKRHRLDGPGIQRFTDDSKLEYESYYINGKEYTKSNYDVKIFNMKLALLCQNI